MAPLYFQVGLLTAILCGAHIKYGPVNLNQKNTYLFVVEYAKFGDFKAQKSQKFSMPIQSTNYPI